VHKSETTLQKYKIYSAQSETTLQKY